MKSQKRILLFGMVCLLAAFGWLLPAWAQEITPGGDRSASGQEAEQTQSEVAVPQEESSLPPSETENPAESQQTAILPEIGSSGQETPVSVAQEQPESGGVTSTASPKAPQSLPAAPVQPESAASSAPEPSSSEQARPSSRVLPEVGSNFSSIDPLQGGTSSDGGDDHRIYGIIAWIAIGIAAIGAVILLLCSRDARDNRVSSGRIYAQKRTNQQKTKHLLDDKYYRNLNRRK